MRVSILGAGPAGLYAAYLLRRRGLAREISIVDQNPAGATFGFGVVFSDRALEFLQEDDQEAYARIRPALETWEDITLNLPEETIRIDGIGFAAVGRLKLLALLQSLVEELDVAPVYDRHVADLSELGEYDLLIAADGVNSLVRRTADFGTHHELLTNRFAWYGTTRRFETLTQTFKRFADGHLNAHHYRYAPDMSTFIVEVDEATYFAAGFDGMDPADARRRLEAIFADELQGHELVANKSDWRQFPRISNARWFAGNRVLVGDALRTAHFSIGSGTRLAMEDVTALVRALEEHRRDIPSALAAYQAARQPIVEKLVGAANASADWYERFPEHMKLEPWRMAMSYIMRSGRVDMSRLRQVSPQFIDAFERRYGSCSGAVTP